MKRLFLSFFVVAIYMGGHDSIAQETAEQENHDQSVNPTSHGAELISFFLSSVGIDVLKNAIKNSDGSFTIKAGQQSIEANALNRKVCDAFGAADVTNEIDITMEPATSHVGICVGPTRTQSTDSAQDSPRTQNLLSSEATKKFGTIPCISISSIQSVKPTRNDLAGHVSCTSPILDVTYAACFGENCTLIRNIDEQ